MAVIDHTMVEAIRQACNTQSSDVGSSWDRGRRAGEQIMTDPWVVNYRVSLFWECLDLFETVGPGPSIPIGDPDVLEPRGISHTWGSLAYRTGQVEVFLERGVLT